MEAQNLEKIETIQFEVSVELYCYKQSRFGNTHIEVVAVFHIYQVYRKRNFICRTFFFIGIYTLFNLKCSFDLIFQDYHFETHHKVEIPLALKKKPNKQVLSSQALNVGRSLGLSTQVFRDTPCIKMFGNPQ